MKRLLPALVVLAIVGAFASTLIFLYARSRARPTVWRTQKPVIADITRKTVATGAIVPRVEVAIKPRVSGVIEKLYVLPGDLVAVGAPIARIKLIPDLVSVNQAESAVATARLAFESADRELKRNLTLQDRGVLATSEIDQLRTEFAVRKSELEAARSNLQLLREGVSSKTGQVSNLVTSTVAGKVLEVPVKEGESVTETNTFNAGTTIASIADMRDMIFLGKVDESEVGKIEKGMDLEIKVGALADVVLRGKLEYVSPKGVTVDGTIQFEVKAAVTMPDGVLLRAGYSANSEIVLDRRSQVLAIKESLLQFEKDDAPFVEVEVGPQRFERRAVEVGLSDGMMIEVKAGVDATSVIKDPIAPKS